MAASDPVLVEFLALLERLSIRYTVGGSVASGLHGEPRSTHDTDVLVELRREQSKALVRELRPAFYVDEEGLRRALDESSSFNVIHVAGARKFDVFVAGSGILDREQMARAVRVRIDPDGPLVPVTSAEVIVLRKLDWFRRGGEASERQWRDVLSVLRVQRGRLDETYLEQMAAELGLADLLARARSSAR